MNMEEKCSNCKLWTNHSDELGECAYWQFFVKIESNTVFTLHDDHCEHWKED